MQTWMKAPFPPPGSRQSWTWLHQARGPARPGGKMVSCDFRQLLNPGISVGVDGWLSPNSRKRWTEIVFILWQKSLKPSFSHKNYLVKFIGMCVNSSQFPGNMGSYIRWYFFRVMHLSNCCLQDMLDETGRTKPILIESESKLLGEAFYGGGSSFNWSMGGGEFIWYIYIYIYIH